MTTARTTHTPRVDCMNHLPPWADSTEVQTLFILPLPPTPSTTRRKIECWRQNPWHPPRRDNSSKIHPLHPNHKNRLHKTRHLAVGDILEIKSGCNFKDIHSTYCFVSVATPILNVVIWAFELSIERQSRTFTTQNEKEFRRGCWRQPINKRTQENRKEGKNFPQITKKNNIPKENHVITVTLEQICLRN